MKAKIFKYIKVILISVLALVAILFGSVWLLLKFPKVQNYAVHKATTFVSNKTNTTVKLEKIDLAFPKSLLLQGIFLDDLNQDTLIYVDEIAIDINLMQLLFRTISVSEISIDGVNANIYKSEKTAQYNFQFLIDAFASKDTTATPTDTTKGKPWKFEIEDVLLTHFQTSYLDSVQGLFATADFDKIKVEVDELDLDKKNVSVNNILLDNINGKLIKTKNVESPEKTDTTAGWNTISVQNITVKSTKFLYKDVLSNMLSDNDVKLLKIEDFSINLQQGNIKSQLLQLEESTILFNSIATNKNATSTTKKKNVAQKGAPSWTVELKLLEMKDNKVAINTSDSIKLKEGIDFKHLNISKLNSKIYNTFYSTDSIISNIRLLSFQEQSGFGIQEFSGDFRFTPTGMALSDFIIKTNNSKIAQNLNIKYASIDQIAKPESVQIDLNKIEIDLHDLLYFAPGLAKQKIIQQNLNKKISATIVASGNLEKLTAKKVMIDIDSSLSLFATVSLRNLTNMEQLAWNAIVHHLNTSDNAIYDFVPSMQNEAYRLPHNINLKGTSKGNLKLLEADLQLTTEQGNIAIKGNAKNVTSTEIEYHGKLSVDNVNVAYLLKDTATFGHVTMNHFVKGQGIDPQKMNATIKSTIASVDLKNHDYKNISLLTVVANNAVKLDAVVQDTNLNMTLQAEYANLSQPQKVLVNMVVAGVDLKAVGLSGEQIRCSGRFNVQLQDLFENTMSGSIVARDAVILKAEKRYTVDTLLYIAFNQKNEGSNTGAALLHADFKGDLALNQIGKTLSNHFKMYYNANGKVQFIKPTPTQFQFSININDSPIIYELFLPKLESYTPAPIVGSYNSVKSEILLNASFPRIVYGNIDVKNLKININSDSSKLNYGIDLKALKYGEYALTNTAVGGNVSQNIVAANLVIKGDKDFQKLVLATHIKKNKEGNTVVKIINESMILDGETWKVNPMNEIIFCKNVIFKNFILDQGQESIKLTSNTKESDMVVDIKNFQLQHFSKLIEQQDSLARGVLDGNFKLLFDKANNTTFIADLNIAKLSFKNSSVGDIALKADNKDAANINVLAKLRGHDNIVNIAGTVGKAQGQQLDLNIDIQKLNLKSIEAFTMGQISQTSGFITGSVDITGNTQKPRIDGYITTQDAVMNVSYINSKLTLKKETIKFDNKGIYFSNFTMRDTLSNTAVLDGKVSMKEFSDFNFDLKLKTNKFLVLNTTALINKLYYGKVTLNSTIDVSGTPQYPVLSADITINEGSSFTFAIPESKMSIDRGDGIVEFVSYQIDTNAIMRKEMIEPTKSNYSGIDLTARIHIDKNSTLKVMIDPASGDSLIAKGDANLNFALDPSGKMSLTGSYELSGGSYQASLQDLIKKEFIILPNSKIIWNGDPLEATIDITAQYTTRTTAADLMSGTSSGADSSALTIPIDFLINLIMKGELLKPILSFEIDMPINSRGLGGGAIYTKLNKLNETPSELNKQVFSLLLLNRFVPASSGSGGGGASGVARSSLSKMLSDELNKLSAQHIKGVQLNFDLQSYNRNNNGRTEGTTQLKVGIKKELLDEKLSVQVGSNVNLEGPQASKNNLSNLTGDVVLEYKLTEDGRYKLKGFRQNQFDGISNGVITQTGIGILYRREFEKTIELFMSPEKLKLRNEKKKEERERKESAK